MSVQKQSVSFTEGAYAFARELVDSGEYPNVSAAVSGVLIKAKSERDREKSLLQAELERRLSLPIEEWTPVGDVPDISAGARAYLASLDERS